VSATLLRARDLSGGYGDITVVRHFSATIAEGEAVFVIGRNGVGKSTLIKLLMGHLPITAGHVTFQGREVTTTPDHRRRLLGMGYAPQESIVFDELTVRENLTLHYRKGSLDRYRASFDRFPFLRERLAQKAGTLSGGEKKILSFCRVLAEDTALVVLDEPTEGVQPENIARMTEVMEDAAAAGRAFLIVEQNLNVIEQLADRVHLLDHGECVFEAKRGSNLRDDVMERLRI